MIDAKWMPHLEDNGELQQPARSRMLLRGRLAAGHAHRVLQQFPTLTWDIFGPIQRQPEDSY